MWPLWLLVGVIVIAAVVGGALNQRRLAPPTGVKPLGLKIRSEVELRCVLETLSARGLRAVGPIRLDDSMAPWRIAFCDENGATVQEFDLDQGFDANGSPA
jgi:hypothetical protein